MARTFRGEFTLRVDGKGRVSIPADFRRELELGDPDWTPGAAPRFVLVYGDAGQCYFECYTIEAAEEVDARILALPRGSKRRRLLEELFSARSLKLTVDETGRIVLPQRQRDKLGLDEQAYFLATSDTFQIWKPETYEARRQPQIDAWRAEYGAETDPLSLLDEPLTEGGAQ